MIKLFSKDKEKHKIPKSIQDCIPINKIWDNGICEVDKNRYSFTYIKFLNSLTFIFYLLLINQS